MSDYNTALETCPKLADALSNACYDCVKRDHARIKLLEFEKKELQQFLRTKEAERHKAVERVKKFEAEGIALVGAGTCTDCGGERVWNPAQTARVCLYCRDVRIKRLDHLRQSHYRNWQEQEEENIRLEEQIASLFTVIEHGDNEHRAWLKDKIDSHFGLKGD